MKFKIGDKVWVRDNNPKSDFPPGTHAGVVIDFWPEPTYPYVVDVPACPAKDCSYFPPTHWVASDKELTPRDDPDEIKREELGSWDLCPWQPNKVRA